MEKCVRCGVDGNQVKLFDGIYQSKMSKICERCSLIENVLIIKKPETSQIKESQKSLGVYERMKVISSPRDSKKKIDTLFVRERLKELDKKPKPEHDSGQKLDLVDYYYWVIMRYRRKKGLTQERLSEAIGEPLDSIKRIEKGELPKDAEILVNKLEKFFHVRLIKSDLRGTIIQDSHGRKRTSPVLLDEEGRELDHIPEPETGGFEGNSGDEEEPREEREESVKKVGFFKRIQEKVGIFGREKMAEEYNRADEEDEVKEPEEKSIRSEPRKELLKANEDFDVRKVDPKSVTIADLRDVHRKRVEVTKLEKTEEKRRIQERQKLIEARKEELRMMKERQSKELDHILGGKELLEKDDSFEEDLR
jgi:ribosome-binding protein aMBF1 (putative translation factor)